MSDNYKNLKYFSWQLDGSRDITFSFLEYTPSYYTPDTDQHYDNFQELSQRQKTAALDSMQQVSNFANINFVEVEQTPDYVGKITWANARLDSGVAAHAYYPYLQADNTRAGDIWDNTRYNYDYDRGDFGHKVFMHELGHALGLKHTFDSGLSGTENSYQYSVMAYSNTNPYNGYPDTFMLYDIAALQDLYGANHDYNAGDTTYTLESGKIWTLWDGAGHDTLDASSLGSSVRLDLRDGYFSDISQDNDFAIAYNAIIEDATGTNYNDSLRGNAFDNVLLGRSGDDTLEGGQGQDTLDGGSGSDTAVFSGLVSDFSFAFSSLYEAVVTSVSTAIDWGINTVLDVESYQFDDVSLSAEQLFNTYDGYAPDSVLNFDTANFYDYGGNNNKSDTYETHHAGVTLELNENTWKMVDYDYTVTENTILEFDFKSNSLGEIHGIGFDTDTSLSENQAFSLYGTQNWGLDAYKNYTASEGEWLKYKIDVGSYYTGQFTNLFFINDHDVSNPEANSWFKNVKVYEEEPDVPTGQDTGILDFQEYRITSFSDQDLAGDVAADGAQIDLYGNAWKRINLDYEVTESSVLTFNFRSDEQGEIHGIGLDTDNDHETDKVIKIYGTQNWGQDGPDYNPDGSGAGSLISSYQAFEINLADYYDVGTTYSALTFVSDDDANASSHSSFSNVRIYDKDTSQDPPAPQDPITFNKDFFSSFSNQDIDSQMSIGRNADEITLSGNAWKKYEYKYQVTQDSVLKFDFLSENQGEIHGIGLDTDNDHETDKVIKIYGTQNWGQDGPDYTLTQGDAAYQTFEINLADYYEVGTIYSSLTFVSDDDADANSHSSFKNVMIYEDTPDGSLYGTNTSDTFLLDAIAQASSTDIQEIHGFNPQEGDTLDVANLLEGYDPLSDSINDFVQITSQGSDSIVRVDSNGGADNFIDIATLIDTSGLSDVDDLESAGNLITV